MLFKVSANNGILKSIDYVLFLIALWNNYATFGCKAHGKEARKIEQITSSNYSQHKLCI